jgi:hypothetical protein
MARNGSGTYTVPNSFTPSTTIDSSDVNQNFTDLGDEITNSVAVDGQSVMTGALKAANGAAGTPSITFGSDLNTGIYRIGSDNIGVAANGAKVLDIATTGLSITGTLTPSGQIVSIAGTKTAPGYTFSSDLDTGLYQIGANNIGVSCGDTKILDIASTGLTLTGTLDASGNFAINTSKFTVAASSGNTVVAGTLGVTGDVAVNSNKFTVTASSGNTAVAGTLSVTGQLTADASGGIVAKNAARAFATFGVSGTTVNFTKANNFNIESITRTGTGTFTVAFTTALPSTNYVVIASGEQQTGNISSTGFASSKTTSGFTLNTLKTTELGNIDPTVMDFVVFGI